MHLLHSFSSYLLIALLAGIPSGPAFSQLTALQVHTASGVAASDPAVQDRCQDRCNVQDFAQNTAPDGDDTSDASAANALDDVIHSLIVGVDPFFLASSTAIPREARLQSADPREDIRPPRPTNLLI